jgi:predicted nucleic acid-binding protein
MAEIGLFELIVSERVLLECERNLRKKLPADLPVFAELLAHIEPEIVSDPPAADIARWEKVIASKDAPILGAAVQAGAERLLTLDLRDFTETAAAESNLVIQTPGEFVENIRSLVDAGV